MLNKIFISFKPDPNISYGGGNISVYYIVNYIEKKYNNIFTITYELEDDISIYLIIDPFKDKKFKKYGIDDIINHKNKFNKQSKILIRVNDCDITREIKDISRSREHSIISNYNNIDFLIFNSNFIKSYYSDKIIKQNIKFNENYKTITNGCDQTLFLNSDKQIDVNKKIKIVTHHWSNNMNKGYETYSKLYEYCKNSDTFEFIFIGKNIPDMFNHVPIIGPYFGKELSINLNDCHIYITDSKFDSCPNHVLEAICCGLPILYSNVDGGAKELCTMSSLDIGEIYNSFDELIEKMNKIINNYDYYRNNINKSLNIYSLDTSLEKYMNVFLSNLKDNVKIKLNYENNIVVIDNPHYNNMLILDNQININLIKGRSVFVLNKNTYKNIQILYSCDIDCYQFGVYKLNNNFINLLLCSDDNYFVGLFAVLNSVIENTNYINVNFNFIVPLDLKNRFPYLLTSFERKTQTNINKTIIYLDKNIIDPVIFNSKCYNGGGHLLNVGNFSRLLIGELMLYEKLVYLDSDSIVQKDIFENIMDLNMEYDIYCCCANKINKKNTKQIVIKMENILNFNNNNLNELLKLDIDKNDYAFLGAPFITDCKKWKNIYRDTINLIKVHNNTHNGIYKLFTMSIQNILFYKKTGNIMDIFPVLQDLGSKRKKWEQTDLDNQYVIDWSGIFKPWYKNGLYREYWLKYDILNLSNDFENVELKKHTIEKFI